MGGASSRRKGHSFERWVAIALRVVFPGARRQLEYHENDCRGIDIADTGRYKIQCKKLADYAPVARIFEVDCDRLLGEVPVLVTAGDNREPMAVLPFSDFLAVLQRVVRANRG